MKTIFTIVFFGIINMAIAQDEFFQPGSSIGGYGELHWNKANDAATIIIPIPTFFRW